MNQETLGRLMDMWSNDGSFRDAVRRNPLKAVEGAGIALSDEEKEAVSNFDWSLSDEELSSRASHCL